MARLLTQNPSTCFFALGLASSTPQGAEILDEYGWESTISPVGLPTGLCIPADIDKFVMVRNAFLFSRGLDAK